MFNLFKKKNKWVQIKRLPSWAYKQFLKVDEQPGSHRFKGKNFVYEAIVSTDKYTRYDVKFFKKLRYA